MNQLAERELCPTSLEALSVTMATAAHEAAAAAAAPAGEDPQRPYTIGTFQSKLNRFQDLIREITYQDYEATPEERRQWITGKQIDI